MGPPCRRPGPLCARASVSLFRGPRLPAPSPPSTAHPRGPRASTPRPPRPCSPQRQTVVSTALLKSPTRTHFPSASFISPLHTHSNCARPFFKLARAPPLPGLLRPNPPLAELVRRPRPCSATARQSLTVVLASPEVNFPAGLLFLSPLVFSVPSISL
jgi:hypothetical protein